MSEQAEGDFIAAREQVKLAPDDLKALREFAEAARAINKREDAVSAMKASYQRRPTPELYAELRSICTHPEFQLIEKPPDPPVAVPAKQAGTGAELLPRKAFRLLLDQAIFFPVQDGTSVFILAVSAVLMAVGDLFRPLMGGFGIVATLICYGFVFGYLWSVMHSSGMGEKHSRGWPDFSHPEDFAQEVGPYFMVSVICFGPAVAFLLSHPFEELQPNVLGAIALALLGILYFPMALMLAGFTHNVWEALNLPSAVRSILKMPVDYLICLAFFVISYIVIVVMEWFFGQLLWANTMPGPVMILLLLFVKVSGVYLLVVQMRTVGLLFYAREKDLGWFQ